MTPDGKKIRKIIVDAKDRDKIPVIINRERKRHGLPPLSDDELAVEISKLAVNSLVNPTVLMNVRISYAYLRHAMFKIAYELAFLWLGETYLDDPLAIELRNAICEPDITSMDRFLGFVGEAPECDAFSAFWKPHLSHHLAYSQASAGNVVIAVRIFDLYAARIVVSADASRYFGGPNAHPTELRFLAIDAVERKMVDTTFAQEIHRIVTTWQSDGTFPSPVPDPL